MSLLALLGLQHKSLPRHFRIVLANKKNIYQMKIYILEIYESQMRIIMK